MMQCVQSWKLPGNFTRYILAALRCLCTLNIRGCDQVLKFELERKHCLSCPHFQGLEMQIDQAQAVAIKEKRRMLASAAETERKLQEAEALLRSERAAR